jgi:hypothetical protein
MTIKPLHFFNIIKEKNEPLFYFGWLCLLGTVVCFLLTQTSRVEVLGISAWWKPFKFWFSTVTLVWSMAWYMQHLRNSETAISFFSWAVIALLLTENIWITYKAGLGQLSHYDLSTPFNSLMFSVMASAAAGISILVAYIGLLFFANSVEPLPKAYLWGIRFGILLFFIFSMQGFSMGARMAHTIGADDGSPGLPVVNWSKQYGDLRIAHFMGMHALQIIPFMAYSFFKNVVLISIFALAYSLFTAFLLYQALQGRPLFG